MADACNVSLELRDNSALNFDNDPGFNFSNGVTVICQWILYSCVCQSISLFGIVTNCINIVCFVKQGFKDPVNISFLGLALADIGCLTTLVWSNMCFTPAFAEADLPFHTIEFQYLTSGMPNTFFTRVSSWITAVITLERCMCITAPLKVKNLVTTKRVCIIIITIYMILISSAAPMYVVNSLGMKYYPSRNQTLLGLVYTEDRVTVDKISFAINNIMIPFGAFAVITICTIILVTKLQETAAWRNRSSTSRQGGNVSSRNQKVAKMVVMISTLFLVCFIPICIIFIAALLVPDLHIDGKYKNMVIVFGGVGFVLEAINSSANIFIYYYMSSKYRDIFNKCVWCIPKHMCMCQYVTTL